MNFASIALFIASLVGVAIATHFFIRGLMNGLPLNILTVPTIIFCWTYFVVVPAVNIFTDTYVDERVFIVEPIDSMALLNLVNIVMLAIALLGVRTASLQVRNSVLSQARPNAGLFFGLLVLILVSIVYGVYTIFLSGSVLIDVAGRLQFTGSIGQYIIIESGPIAFCWLVTIYCVRTGRQPSAASAIVIGLVQLIMIFALSSSRGSRVAIISQALFCAQIYSFYLFRFRAYHYLAGIAGLALMLPVYAYYKYGGVNALEDFLLNRGSSQVVENYNNPITFLIGDIGRADIQAPLISRYTEGTFQPNYFGETYLSALALVLPKDLRPRSLRPKTEIGADAQLDPGASAEKYRGVILSEGAFTSSRIYGLLGESIINFGWVGPIVAFFIFGILSRLALIRAVYAETWYRLLTTPFFAALPIYFLFYDFDNLVVQTITVWALPVLLLTVFRLGDQ